MSPERSTRTDTDTYTTLLISKDGTTLSKDKGGFLCRWQDHFTKLLNRDSHVEADSFENVPAVPVTEELDYVIHIEKVRMAVKLLKCNTASGGDCIPAEV